jgi:hypothetical protein
LLGYQLDLLTAQGAYNLVNLSVANMLLVDKVSTIKYHLSGVNTEGIINLSFLILKPVILFLTISLLSPILLLHKQFTIIANLHDNTNRDSKFIVQEHLCGKICPLMWGIEMCCIQFLEHKKVSDAIKVFKSFFTLMQI